jgi:hypothetical protein
MTDEHKENFELVVVKRKWCPEWAYALACIAFRRLMVAQPLRCIFHRELTVRESAAITEAKNSL